MGVRLIEGGVTSMSVRLSRGVASMSVRHSEGDVTLMSVRHIEGSVVSVCQSWLKEAWPLSVSMSFHLLSRLYSVFKIF